MQVGYCQGMNYLAAMLLLALERSEENSFWLLVSLIDDGGECLLIPTSSHEILLCWTSYMTNLKDACSTDSKPSAVPAGILYQGMYSQNLVGAHVEMRSLQVALLPRWLC